MALFFRTVQLSWLRILLSLLSILKVHIGPYNQCTQSFMAISYCRQKIAVVIVLPNNLILLFHKWPPFHRQTVDPRHGPCVQY